MPRQRRTPVPPVEILDRRNDSVTLALGPGKPNRLGQHRLRNVNRRSHGLSPLPLLFALRTSLFALRPDRLDYMRRGCRCQRRPSIRSFPLSAFGQFGLGIWPFAFRFCPSLFVLRPSVLSRVPLIPSPPPALWQFRHARNSITRPSAS